MRHPQPRNYVSEEAAKSRELLQGLKCQLHIATCKAPSVDELSNSNSSWAIPDLERARVRLNACKDRMDNMDAG